MKADGGNELADIFEIHGEDLSELLRMVGIDALAAQLDAIYTLYEEDRGPTTQLEVLEIAANSLD